MKKIKSEYKKIGTTFFGLKTNGTIVDLKYFVNQSMLNLAVNSDCRYPEYWWSY